MSLRLAHSPGQPFDFSLVRPWVENSVKPFRFPTCRNCKIKNVTCIKYISLWLVVIQHRKVTQSNIRATKISSVLMESLLNRWYLKWAIRNHQTLSRLDMWDTEGDGESFLEGWGSEGEKVQETENKSIWVEHKMQGRRRCITTFKEL